jgi:hypothetical protein
MLVQKIPSVSTAETAVPPLLLSPAYLPRNPSGHYQTSRPLVPHSNPAVL